MTTTPSPPPDHESYPDLTAWLRAWLGHEIKRRRTKAGITAQQLATRVGVGIGQVFRWEAGTNEPTYERLAAVADELICSVGELFPAFTRLRKARRHYDRTA